MIAGIILLALVWVALAGWGMFMIIAAWRVKREEKDYFLSKVVGYFFGGLFAVGPVVAVIMLALKCF